MFICCTKCNEGVTLHTDEVDSRQEWVEEYLSCPNCGHGYVLRTNYGIQSSKIQSQVLIDNDGNEINF